MKEYIDKAAVKAEIEGLKRNTFTNFDEGVNAVAQILLDFLNTLEVEDPYEQCVQYDSIKASIQAHAETYSFNIESQLFPQLTKEQQALWRKEIEQAVISGGDAGVTLARDQRYKENLEVEEVGEPSNDLEEEIELVKGDYEQVDVAWNNDFDFIARHFYELGLKEQLKNK